MITFYYVTSCVIIILQDEKYLQFRSLGIEFDIFHTYTFTESVRITDSNKEFPDFSSAIKVNNSTQHVSFANKIDLFYLLKIQTYQL